MLPSKPWDSSTLPSLWTPTFSEAQTVEQCMSWWASLREPQVSSSLSPAAGNSEDNNGISTETNSLGDPCWHLNLRAEINPVLKWGIWPHFHNWMLQSNPFPNTYWCNNTPSIRFTFANDFVMSDKITFKLNHLFKLWFPSISSFSSGLHDNC